jgi:hypothetical protein
MKKETRKIAEGVSERFFFRLFLEFRDKSRFLE